VRNRVTPTGEIVDIAQRGTLMGNRGVLHRGYEIVRPWQTKRWIACALSYRGWVAPKWAPGRWTALFFLDEAVALAAGHRPCALCRHADYVRWQHAWAEAVGGSTRADAMDARLHGDRVDGRAQRTHRRSWSSLPTGAFVRTDDGPARVTPDALFPWFAGGYGEPRRRPTRGDATVLTPSCTVDVLLVGYAIG
jgi:hypothetical protein